MAFMLYDNKESYINTLHELLPQCDIFALDKLLNLALKHLYNV